MLMCLSERQMLLLPSSCLVSGGGAAFWLTKAVQPAPTPPQWGLAGGRNCRQAVSLELQQAIVQDTAFALCGLI